MDFLSLMWYCVVLTGGTTYGKHYKRAVARQHLTARGRQNELKGEENAEGYLSLWRRKRDSILAVARSRSRENNTQLFSNALAPLRYPCLLGKRFSIQRALSSRIVEMCSRHSLASFLVALLTSFVKNSYRLFFTPHPL